MLHGTCIKISFLLVHILLTLFIVFILSVYFQYTFALGGLSPKSPEEAFRFAQLEPTWAKMNQANLVPTASNKSLVPPLAEFDGSDVSSVTSSNSKLSLAAQPQLANTENITSNDAQVLANVLQKQLDAINEELE